MPKQSNKTTVINRKSTKREAVYRRIYAKIVPAATVVGDGKDISAVTDQNGKNGIALLSQSVNRSRKKTPVQGENFVSLEDLRKHM